MCIALPTIAVAVAEPELTMHIFPARRDGTYPDPGGKTLEMPCEWSGVTNTDALSDSEIYESTTGTGIRFGSAKLAVLIRQSCPSRC